MERWSYGQGGSWLAFALFLVVALLPFYWIVLSSITPKEELFALPLDYWPASPTLANYRALFENIAFGSYFVNSMIFSVGSAVVSVLFGFLAAYAFARLEFPGSNVIFLAFLISTALPPISTLLPLFELFRAFRLVNTHAGLIVLMSSTVVPFTVWVLVTFIRQVPEALDEAAIIEGCSRFAVIFRIVMPVTTPALATMFLLNFIIAWNELLIPLVFAITAKTKTLSVGITELAVKSTSFSKPWELISAMGVTMIIPVVLLVIFFQGALVRGLTQGAVK